MTTSATAVIYVRASTKEQTNSCDQQIAECRAKAKHLGLEITEVFKDEGI